MKRGRMGDRRVLRHRFALRGEGESGFSPCTPNRKGVDCKARLIPQSSHSTDLFASAIVLACSLRQQSVYEPRQVFLLVRNG